MDYEPTEGLIERAKEHYYTECAVNGWIYQEPDASEDMQYVIDGEREFVKLANISGPCPGRHAGLCVNGVLAVYELMDGELISSSTEELVAAIYAAEYGVGRGAL